MWVYGTPGTDGPELEDLEPALSGREQQVTRSAAVKGAEQKHICLSNASAAACFEQNDGTRKLCRARARASSRQGAGAAEGSTTSRRRFAQARGDRGDFCTSSSQLRSSRKLNEPLVRACVRASGAHAQSSWSCLCTEEGFMWRGRRPPQASGTTAARFEQLTLMNADWFHLTRAGARSSRGSASLAGH